MTGDQESEIALAFNKIRDRFVKETKELAAGLRSLRKLTDGAVDFYLDTIIVRLEATAHQMAGVSVQSMDDFLEEYRELLSPTYYVPVDPFVEQARAIVNRGGSREAMLAGLRELLEEEPGEER